MRLLFVNHAHPDIPHVSGMRLGRFAREMAQRGHRVVLLTCSLPGSDGVDPAGAALSKRIQQHDWAMPLVVAVPARATKVLELIRHNRVPAIARKALTLGQFLAHKGVFADWEVPARRAAEQLAREFGPQLVWGTFGNTSTLALAQRAARYARCPWVMDIKDNWEEFVPRGIRGWLAQRFHGATRWTANSVHHQHIAQRWFSDTPSLVTYSGVSEEFFARGTPAVNGRKDLLLVGSTYSAARLETYLDAVRGWMTDLSPDERLRLRFVYAGSDHARVDNALQRSRLPCETVVLHQISVTELAGLARNAFANSYLRVEVTFHQKLLELLVCGRPLICFPAESSEATAFAAQVSTPFYSCGTPAALRTALATTWQACESATTSTFAPPPWHWSDFADGLERFFQQLVDREERS